MEQEVQKQIILWGVKLSSKQINLFCIYNIYCLKFLYYFFFSCEIESWGVLDITLGKKVCQWHTVDRWFSIGTPVSFTIKSDRHDITEILLKVVLNTINLIPNLFCLFQLCYIWPVHTVPHFIQIMLSFIYHTLPSLLVITSASFLARWSAFLDNNFRFQKHLSLIEVMTSASQLQTSHGNVLSLTVVFYNEWYEN